MKFLTPVISQCLKYLQVLLCMLLHHLSQVNFLTLRVLQTNDEKFDLSKLVNQARFEHANALYSPKTKRHTLALRNYTVAQKRS